VSRKKTEFLSKKSLNMNEQCEYRKIKNRTNRTQIKNIGQYLNRVKRKWENKAGKNSKLLDIKEKCKKNFLTWKRLHTATTGC
jgi:hypothetical protein